MLCLALLHVEERVVGQQVDAPNAYVLPLAGGVDHANEVGGVEAVALAHVDEHPLVALLTGASVLLAVGLASALLLLATLVLAALGHDVEHWCLLVVVEHAVKLQREQAFHHLLAAEP